MLPCNTFLTSELFERVQRNALFKDSKTFADAMPKHSYEEALIAYGNETPSDENLMAFVQKHFMLESITEIRASVSDPENMPQDLYTFITQTWGTLTKAPDAAAQHSSLLALPHSYLVPGGRFQEIYYWDSYFSALGLVEDGNLSLVKDMLDNFVYLQQRFGIIPNGNRAYYLSRSQPPILALLVDLLHNHDATFNRIEYLPALLSEYEFWTTGEANPRAVLTNSPFVASRYYDSLATPRPESFSEDIELAETLPQHERADFYRNLRAACESGWDFSSRWLSDPHDLTSIRTTKILPVDLNALLAITEQTIIDITSEHNKAALYEVFVARKQQRQAFFDKHFWHEDKRSYFDLHIENLSSTDVYSLACVVPLYAKLASDKQAECIASILADKFLQPGGLLTSLSDTAQQWDAPNGWAPLHWFAVQGLRHYGHNELANTISAYWLDNVNAFFKQHGVILEKYNVVNRTEMAGGGEYDVQLGFGWTNGVSIALRSGLSD
jgi:alpha,alpha-trehalase